MVKRMNVLLVNPRYNGCSEIPPLGLECLASLLDDQGIDVSILDLDICSDEEGRKTLYDKLERSYPQIVGVTAMSHSFQSARQVCGIVKKLNPAALTVMGGIHATVRSDEILREQNDIDVCVRGEGETTFRELVDHFMAGQDFSGVKGISFRKDGKVIHNRDRDLNRNLDELPNPAHCLVDNEKYRTRSISSSRGCHHNCTFCSIQAQYHRTVRTRDAASIADEIASLADNGAKRIMFTDDNFTFSLRRVREICGWIERLGLAGKVSFYAEGRIDDVCRNPIIASILSNVGFQGLYIGAESGSAEILEYYGKDMHPGDIMKGVAYCIEQNLTPVLNFILLGPRDTVDTMRETIRLAKQIFEMGAEITYAETLNPYPGTPIQEALAKDDMYREEQGVYYFKSYHGIELEWVLRLCNAARAITELLHREEKHFVHRKTYFEMSYLDELLSGNIPIRFQELYARHDAGKDGAAPADIEEIHRYMIATIKGASL
jgi:anaerobic magnesium-protoporphyrin IX monomethyl ester cyclase